MVFPEKLHVFLSTGGYTFIGTVPVRFIRDILGQIAISHRRCE